MIFVHFLLFLSKNAFNRHIFPLISFSDERTFNTYDSSFERFNRWNVCLFENELHRENFRELFVFQEEKVKTLGSSLSDFLSSVLHDVDVSESKMGSISPHRSNHRCSKFILSRFRFLEFYFHRFSQSTRIVELSFLIWRQSNNSRKFLVEQVFFSF